MKELILLVCFVMTSLAQKDDFLATMPRELRPGMEYHVDISYPTPPRSQVTVYARIRQLNTETSPFAWSQPANSAGEVVIAAGSYMGRITLQVPNSLIPETKYYMFLSFKEDPNQREVTFGSGKEIVVATTPSLMFVQADRGIYKPSTSKEETIVRLRVLRVDEGLKPVVGDNLKLEIRDPKDNIVMKQDNFGNDGGLAEASYSVPRDPFFGTYIAKAEGDWGKANTTFEVAEYVLPKFEVQLELDKSFVVDPFYFGQPNGDVDITGTVKAVYTYGAYVKGTMKITVGNVQETFNNFDGKEEFTIRISRSRQDDLKQLKVFAEMTEEHTEDTANATQPFSIYDAEYRALVIKPIPNTVQGDAEYKFFAQLVDASGKRVENIQDFRWSVRAEMKYNQQTYTESVYGSLDSNPVEITLSPDITKGKDAYYSNITVSFDEIDSQGNIGHASLSANFTPAKYQSNTNQALFINIVNKTTENKQDTLAGECFPVSNRTNTFDIVQLDTVSLFNLSFQRRHCLKVHAKRRAERLTIQVVAEAGRYNVALQKVQQLGSGREKHLKTSMYDF